MNLLLPGYWTLLACIYCQSVLIVRLLFEGFGYESFEEMDFDACGYTEQIENAIDEKIALIEE